MPNRSSFPLGRAIAHGVLLLLLSAGAALALLVPAAWAAEIRSIREPTLLQIGDQNRNYQVELACIEVKENNRAEAVSWLRQQGARGTKVNLRPIGEREGRLVAKVRILKTGVDLGDALVAEGLASSLPCLDQQPSG